MGGKAQHDFCGFIERYCKSPGFMTMVQDSEKELEEGDFPPALRKTMRMTLLS
jgi:hypothetical protein